MEFLGNESGMALKQILIAPPAVFLRELPGPELEHPLGHDLFARNPVQPRCRVVDEEIFEGVRIDQVNGVTGRVDACFELLKSAHFQLSGDRSRSASSAAARESGSQWRRLRGFRNRSPQLRACGLERPSRRYAPAWIAKHLRRRETKRPEQAVSDRPTQPRPKAPPAKSWPRGLRRQRAHLEPAEGHRRKDLQAASKSRTSWEGTSPAHLRQYARALLQVVTCRHRRMQQPATSRAPSSRCVQTAHAQQLPPADRPIRSKARSRSSAARLVSPPPSACECPCH